MFVEAECTLIRRRVPDVTQAQYDIKPGSSENINFFEPNVRIVVLCSIDGTMGSVIAVGNHKDRFVVAHLFENDEDDEGKQVSLEKPIRIFEHQCLYLWNKKGIKKEVFVALNDEGENFRDELLLPGDIKPLMKV